jgi:hypothetical protein
MITLISVRDMPSASLSFVQLTRTLAAGAVIVNSNASAFEW